MKDKPTLPEYILASYYLSMLYGFYAELGWMAINTNYRSISTVLRKIATGEALAYESIDMTTNKSKEERIFGHMKWMLFARGRKITDQYDQRFSKAAKEFVEKHKLLFSELALTWAKDEEKRAKPTVTLSAPGFIMPRAKP